MKKAFDKTLEAFTDLEDAADYIKTHKTISDGQKSRDLDEIIMHLEQAKTSVVDSLVIFHKYESEL